MKDLRSRGYREDERPTVTIEVQLPVTRAEALQARDVAQWIRKIRRRYANTDGVEYRVRINRLLDRQRRSPHNP